MTSPDVQLRITKYDPAHRASDGRYMLEEWTAFDDIERGKVTKADYLKTENAYIKAAQLLLAENDVSSLTLEGTENSRGHTPAPPKRVTLEDLPEVVRPVLREHYWTRLQTDTAFVHIGYDFYMYVGVAKASDATLSKIKAMGLFIEGFTSPYLTREDDT